MWEGGGGEDEEKRVPSEEKKGETEEETKGVGESLVLFTHQQLHALMSHWGFHLKYHTLILTKCDSFPRFSA